MRRLARAALAATLPVALLLMAAPAHTAEVPTRCKPDEPASAINPPCQWVRATVTGYADGDTFDVRQSDGVTYRVRSIGINAMELSKYHLTDPSRRVDQECTAAPAGYRGHGVAAATRAQQLIRAAGGEVYLAAQDLRHATIDDRRRRSVWTRVDGVWTDVSRVLVKEGLALWMANPEEWAHTEYGYWTQRAAAAGVGLFDPDKCGYGPAGALRPRLLVNWDAEGADDANLNGEWVRITNPSRSPLPLGGWWLRDALKPRGTDGAYVFSRGTVVQPGASITVHVGRGVDSPRHRYWGQRRSMFTNVGLRHGLGEGAYLFDPEGDLRAWSTYPCRLRYHDALKGKVTVRAHPTTPEYVDIKNVSASAVSLKGHVLKEPVKQYHFLTRTVLRPGATLRLHLKGSPRRNTALYRFWGQLTPVLSDHGDVVRLRSYNDIPVSCHRWGSGPTC